MRKPSLTTKGDFESYLNKATSNIVVNLEFEVHNGVKERHCLPNDVAFSHLNESCCLLTDYRLLKINPFINCIVSRVLNIVKNRDA